MTVETPLASYQGTVQPDWLDWNDHMNVAYFVLAFDLATDGMYRYMRVAEDYIESRRMSMFALETHVTYQAELRRDESFRITTQVLDADAKRINYFHTMHHGREGHLVATSNWISIHVDLERRRVVPFPDDIAAWLSEIREAHAALPRPPEAGRVLSLDAGKPR